MREFANDICLAFFVSSLDRYWNDHIQRKSVLNKGARGVIGRMPRRRQVAGNGPPT